MNQKRIGGKVYLNSYTSPPTQPFSETEIVCIRSMLNVARLTKLTIFTDYQFANTVLLYNCTTASLIGAVGGGHRGVSGFLKEMACGVRIGFTPTLPIPTCKCQMQTFCMTSLFCRIVIQFGYDLRFNGTSSEPNGC
jgi:hypothetical protein